jgi:hypothetical protein
MTTDVNLAGHDDWIPTIRCDGAPEAFTSNTVTIGPGLEERRIDLGAIVLRRLGS